MARIASGLFGVKFATLLAPSRVTLPAVLPVPAVASVKLAASTVTAKTSSFKGRGEAAISCHCGCYIGRGGSADSRYGGISLPGINYLPAYLKIVIFQQTRTFIL